jgi:hypothetical protein
MHEYKDNFYQSRTPSQMIEEIVTVRNRYGLKLAYFNDDDLARNLPWIDEFCYEAKQNNIQFCGSARADSILQDRTLIATMAQSGCTFMNLAVESAVPATQKFLRRGRIDNEQVLRACRECEQAGIKIRLQNMIGLPVENPLEDALETLRFNQEATISDSWAAIFQPFPKTELHTYCVEQGLLQDGVECGTFYEGSPLKIKDKERIERLHKWWHLAAKHKIPIDAVRAILDIPLVSEQAKIMQDIRWKEGAKTLYGIGVS